MHNVHFILTVAENAEEAAIDVINNIEQWGNENNGFSIGGVTNLDQSDQLDSYDPYARWTLSYLTDSQIEEEDLLTTARKISRDSIKVSKENCLEKFEEGCQEVRSFIKNYQTFSDLRNDSYPNSMALFRLQQILEDMETLYDSDHKWEVLPHKFDKVGLTFLSLYNKEIDEIFSNPQNYYIVLLDMHS